MPKIGEIEHPLHGRYTNFSDDRRTHRQLRLYHIIFLGQYSLTVGYRDPNTGRLAAKHYRITSNREGFTLSGQSTYRNLKELVENHASKLAAFVKTLGHP